MARKPRDHKAEWARRQELARQRGFTSRYKERKARATGAAPAIRPKALRNPKSVAAHRKYTQAHGGAYDQALARFQQSREDDARDYSAAHAHRQIAKFDYKENAAKGVTYDEYLDAYYNAFIEGAGRYGAVRRSGGSEELRRYFVDITHYYTADEYEVRYGNQ